MVSSVAFNHTSGVGFATSISISMAPEKRLLAGDEGEIGGIPDGAYVLGKPKFRRFGGDGGKRTKGENITCELHEVHSSVAWCTPRALRW